MSVEISHGPSKPPPAQHLISTQLDFWLLGGASIFVWALMVLGDFFRESHTSIDQHYLAIPALFGFLSVVCNHPHFLISYKFGYGSGFKFILKNWIALIVLPLGLIGFLALSFATFYAPVVNSAWVTLPNQVFQFLGLSYRVGLTTDLGTELLSYSIWFMYFTVGWHYSKQVFGCIVVYSIFDQYHLSKADRRWIKLSVFSIAIYNFLYFSSYIGEYNQSGIGQYSYSHVPLHSFGFSTLLLNLAASITGVLFLGTCYFVFYAKFKKTRQIPSWNFLIPWLAFYIWWIPFIRQKEFFFIITPFFHSLQYLAFAYKREERNVAQGKFFYLKNYLKGSLLLIVAFIAFEMAPELLDSILETRTTRSVPFFLISIIVFLNVHHFFIDSVAWKFDQGDLRKSILEESA